MSGNSYDDPSRGPEGSWLIYSGIALILIGLVLPILFGASSSPTPVAAGPDVRDTVDTRKSDAKQACECATPKCPEVTGTCEGEGLQFRWFQPSAPQ